MYGDTRAIRELARTMRTEGTALRAEADALLARSEAVAWTGLAADAMRASVHAQTSALRRTATLADDAAAALDHHADEVDRLKELIASIERTVMSMVAAARDRLAGLVDAVLPDALPDPLDDLLDRFVPPPSGHRDWLLVDLPGLS